MWKDGSRPNSNAADTPLAVHVIVHGLVQGIGFRAWTASRARDLAIKGWVRNSVDYTVEIFAEGLPDTIDAFIQILKTDHPWARVDKIERTNAQLQNLPTFSIVG